MDYYNVDEKPANVSTRDHYTREVEAWEEIVYLNSAIWGPMFGFGILSLSDLITPITSLYIEHGISNLVIPAYLYGAYLFYEVAVYEESGTSWAEFGSWILISIYTYIFQRISGSSAQYYLRPNEEYADSELRPSLFYLLGWAEHEPRVDYDYGYGYY